MKIKIVKRSIIIWNIIIFLCVSLAFLHIQVALVREISALNLSLMKLNFFNFKEIIFVIFSASLSVFYLKKWSKLLFLLAVGSVASFTILLLIDNFSKIILLVLGVYLISSYYFYQLLNLELDEPCFNPNFSDLELYPPMLKKIPLFLVDNERRINGYITNWSENSCYIYLEDKYNLTKKTFNLEANYLNQTFKGTCELASVAKNLKSIGAYVSFRKNDLFSWGSFCKIIEGQGLTSELIK